MKNKKPKNSMVGIKHTRFGKIIIDTKKAEIVDVSVSAVNEAGGLEVTRFNKEKSADSIKRIAVATEHRNSQQYKARNGGFRGEANQTYDATEPHKPKHQFFGGKKHG